MPRKDAKRLAVPPRSLVQPGTANQRENGESRATRGSSSPGRKPKSLLRQIWDVLKYVLILLCIPPFLNYASLNQEARGLEPEVGAQYDIGFGQKMYLGCMGEGSPTVLLDAPTGMSSDVWTVVQEEVAKITKVCVYDRAGLGFSERPQRNYSAEMEDSDQKNSWRNRNNRWTEFTVERMVNDLHNLVTFSSDQTKPFIYVGSEMGALVGRFYAQLYETDVSDLILVEPLVENIFSQDNGVWTQFWFGHLIPSFQSMQLSAATGITRILLLLGLLDLPIVGPRVPQKVTLRQKYLLCNPRHLSSVVDEYHFINDTFSQMETVWKLKPFPTNISVTVITGNYYDEQLPSTLNKAWAKSQQHLISKLHPGSNHIVVNGADHHMLYRMPEAVIEPIKRAIRLRRAKVKTAKDR